MNARYALPLVVAGLFLGSCSSRKDLSHLFLLQPGQVLDVRPAGVISFQPGDTLMLTASGLSTKMSETLSTAGFPDSHVIAVVDDQGNVEYPGLGKFSVTKADRNETEEKFRHELTSRKLARDPEVEIDFASPGVSVIGEVHRPGRVSISDPEFNILNALHASGDITPYAKRDEILILHPQDNKYTVHAVSLDDRVGLVRSPVFLLSDNDIIFVKPTGQAVRKYSQKSTGRVSSSFWLSVATVLMTTGVVVSTAPDK